MCKICKDKEKSRTKINLTVDHCHKTGKIRGLLCHSCNVVLGLLKEDINRIKNIINYLEGNL